MTVIHCVSWLPIRPAPVVLAQAHIRQIEASRGWHSNPGKGALVGLGVGAGASLLLTTAAAVANGPCQADCGTTVPIFAFLTLAGGGLGAGVGALIGLASRGERWKRVPWGRAHVTLGPHGAGLGISLAL